MIKLNSDYSDYTDENDSNYPLGKAVNASSSESYDGTPLLADFMNDINASHVAMYKKAYGNTTGITGNADNQESSQFADAIAKYSDDKLDAHAATRGINSHGATVEATAGQLITRDESGRAQVSDPVSNEDISTKNYVDTSVDAHASLTDNPHSVTKSQVGLGNCDNTSDANKPVSTATATELGKKVDKTAGVTAVSYDSTNKKITRTINGSTADVVSVSTLKSAMSLVKGDVGLGSVDNTADSSKSVSKAATLTTARYIDGMSFNGSANITHYGTCSTASGTQTKDVACSGFSLVTGARVTVKFSNRNTAGTAKGTSSNKVAESVAPKLNVNSTGAKPIYVGGEPAGEGFVSAGDTHDFVYDGSHWNDVTADVIYASTSSSSGSYAKKRNGLIEQTARFTGKNDTQTWTFTIPFSSTPYAFLNPGQNSGSYAGVQHLGFWEVSTTYAKFSSWSTFSLLYARAEGY